MRDILATCGQFIMRRAARDPRVHMHFPFGSSKDDDSDLMGGKRFGPASMEKRHIALKGQTIFAVHGTVYILISQGKTSCVSIYIIRPF